MQLSQDDLVMWCTAMASDAASDMSGNVSGVQARLKEIIAHLQYVRGPAHQVAIVIRELEENATYKKVFQVDHDIYNCFHVSNKRMDSFQATATAMGLTAKAILQPSGTRWPSHRNCLANNLDNLPIYLRCLYESKDNSAGDLLAVLTDVNTILSMWAAFPLLHELCSLNTYLQTSDITYGDVGERVRDTRATLQYTFVDNTFKGSKKMPDGVLAPWDPFLAVRRMSDESLIQVSSDDDMHLVARVGDLEIPLRYESTTQGVLPCQATPHHLKKIYKRLKASISSAAQTSLDSLRTRFPTTAFLQGLSLIQHTLYKKPVPPSKTVMEVFFKAVKAQLCDPSPSPPNSTLPPAPQQPMRTFPDGRPAPPILDRKLLDLQWPLFKTVVPAAAVHSKSTTQMWQFLKDKYGDSLSEFYTLARYALSLPIGSVENERLFSRMALIKTDLRNRMSDEHLDMCLRVATCTEISYKEFPCDAIVEQFTTRKRRRGMDV